jgi:tripartite-type tricarboxylate transporter receptor subunit TctC
MTGRVQLFMAPLGNAIAHAKDGRLAALGVTSAQRFAQLPDVPTVAESGVPYRWEAWFGLLAPVKTPRAVVARLHADITRALAQPDAVKRLASLGAEASRSTPEQFDRTIREDIATYNKAARAAGIRPD